MNTFALTLRKYIADNRRNLILKLVGLSAYSVFIGFILAYSGKGGGEDQFIVMTVCLCIFASIFASFAFRSMKSPRGRIATLMTPSSTFDKYMARWIVAVPFVWLVTIGAFWLTELSRVVLWGLFNTSHTQFMNIGAVVNYNVRASSFFISLALISQAMFFLGAIVWPRLSFVKTLLAYWVVSTVCSIVFGVSVSHIPPGNYTDLNPLDNLLNIATISAFMLAAVFYLIAYLRFKESDVADRLI